jgi:diguanylate cyclase (GGDEF)-like protein
MMPGLSGPEVCRLVRQAARESYTYILLLTSRSLREDLIEGMEAGADDYVTKPFDTHELKVRLRAGTRVIELQSELLQARETLREQATRDSLTRLWNRSSILETLEREVARSRREHRPVGVVIVDLDHFKHVNDTYGHLVGDAVLVEAGRRMQAGIRDYDAIGRYGGEEFLVVLPGCDQRTTVTQASRLCGVLAGQPIDALHTTIRLTGSFGATHVAAGSNVAAERVVHQADAALYLAKANGRNRVEYQNL